MTELTYLDGTYLFDDKSKIELIGQDDRGRFLILDRTIFYPQGGGQPADKGRIQAEEQSMPVTFVRFLDGQVRHYIPDSLLNDSLVGQSVSLHIDHTYRLNNARLHTGGHLISHVVETINPRLTPIKGYHFPDGAYVEFLNEGLFDGTKLVEEANEKLVSDLSANLDVAARYSDFATIFEIRPSLAAFTPKDKPSRVVSIGGYVPLPCGGTHVGSLSQLGTVKITKTKKQKGNLKVSYQLSELSI